MNFGWGTTGDRRSTRQQRHRPDRDPDGRTDAGRRSARIVATWWTSSSVSELTTSSPHVSAAAVAALRSGSLRLNSVSRPEVSATAITGESRYAPVSPGRPVRGAGECLRWSPDLRGRRCRHRGLPGRPRVVPHGGRLNAFAQKLRFRGTTPTGCFLDQGEILWGRVSGSSAGAGLAGRHTVERAAPGVRSGSVVRW